MGPGRTSQEWYLHTPVEGKQLRYNLPCTDSQFHLSLHCLHKQSIELDKGSDQNETFYPTV